MKYKTLSKEQLLISLDRLTRFKPTKEKYLRVFYDVILSNLIEPKFKRSDVERLDIYQVREFAEHIINSSIISDEINYETNAKIKLYENSVFNNDEDTQILLDNKINYLGILSEIDENSVINLRWLKSLTNTDDLVENRKKSALKFPIEKVLLVEGLTEEILLPAFSRKLGFDFYKYGIQVIPAGGKNQVVKMYYQLADELKIPIFLLLDKDAEDNIRQIEPKLRNIDKIHLVSCGEFEDLLPKSLIVKTVNKELDNFASITEQDLTDGIPEVKNLENIFKKIGLHEFKKADFAKLVRDNINEDSDISEEIKMIINEIFCNNLKNDYSGVKLHS